MVYMQNIYHKVLNSNRMIGRRKELRRKSTTTENLLWQYLRNNSLGFKFKRQYSVVNYVVDFYCSRAKLAIELDGLIHKTSKNYDTYRTRYLNSLGIKEIRFNNWQIENNINLALKEIKNNLPSPEIRRGNEGEVK